MEGARDAAGGAGAGGGGVRRGGDGRKTGPCRPVRLLRIVSQAPTVRFLRIFSWSCGALSAGMAAAGVSAAAAAATPLRRRRRTATRAERVDPCRPLLEQRESIQVGRY